MATTQAVAQIKTAAKDPKSRTREAIREEVGRGKGIVNANVNALIEEGWLRSDGNGVVRDTINDDDGDV